MQINIRTNHILYNKQITFVWSAVSFAVILQYLKDMSDKESTFSGIQLSNNAGEGGSGSNNAGAGGNSGNAGAGRSGEDDGEFDDGTDAFKAANDEDTGTGLGGSDYVGKATGNMIDDSIADTVTGGGTVGDKTSRVSGTTAGGIMGVETEIGGASIGGDTPKAGRAIKSGDIGASDAGKKPSGALGINDKSPKIEINEDDDLERKAVDKGTGTGAAMNNINIADVDAGTGSARRGNQAEMPDEDTGKISGGTMTSTGIDDAALGPEK